MKKTGTLRVNQGVSRLDETRLARATAGDPFAAATNFLANRGLDDDDFIFVTGTEGFIGSVPVIFISEAGLAIPVNAAIPTVAAAPTKAARAAAARKSAAPPERKQSRAKKSEKKAGAQSSSAKGSAKKANNRAVKKGSKKSQ